MYIREDFGNDPLLRLHYGLSRVANIHEDHCVNEYQSNSKKGKNTGIETPDSPIKAIVSVRDIDLERLSRSTTSQYVKTQQFESQFVREMLAGTP